MNTKWRKAINGPALDPWFLPARTTLMRYCLGPWTQNFDALSRPIWRAPAGVVGSIDLRSLLAQNSPGLGFFTTPDAVTLPVGYLEIAQGQIDKFLMNTARRSALAQKLGLADVSGATLLDCLVDLLTLRADPTGATRWKPLMPTHRGNLEIHLGGHSLIWQKRLTLADPEAANVIFVVQENYRRIRQDALEGRTPDPEQHRRVLDALGEKYRVANPEDYFIPPDLPKQTRLKHSTTISDDFNRADNTNISTGAPFSWTEVDGDSSIAGNAYSNGGGATFGVARADSDLSSDDMYATAVLATIGASWTGGVEARFSSSAFTCYNAYAFNNPTTGPWATTKVSAGANTGIGSNTATTVTANDVIRLEVDGSTIRRYKNGGLQDTATDTTHTGYLRSGVGADNSAWRIDDFEAGDLAAGGNPIGRLISGTLLRGGILSGRLAR